MCKGRQLLSAIDLWSMADVYVDDISDDSQFFRANKPEIVCMNDGQQHIFTPVL